MSGTDQSGDAKLDVAPPSPCISVCVLDDDDICEGCFRSSEEIIDWYTATPAEKREIMARVEERRRDAGGIQLL